LDGADAGGRDFSESRNRVTQSHFFTMNLQFRIIFLGLLCQTLGGLSGFAQTTVRGVGKPDAKSREKSKVSSDASANKAATGGAAMQVSTEANAISQLARTGLDVSVIGAASASDLRAFAETVAIIRGSGSSADASTLIRRSNREEGGMDLIKVAPKLLRAGLSAKLITQTDVDELKRVGDLVAELQSTGTSDHRARLRQIIQQCNADQSQWTNLVEALVTNGADGVADLVKNSGNLNDFSETVSFRSKLQEDAKAAFDLLSVDQKKSVASILKGAASDAGISSIITNTLLMKEWVRLVDESGSSIGNPVLQEAAVIGNQIIKDHKWSSTVSLADQKAFSYDSLFPSGYSKELVRMMARYSGSERLVAAVDQFVTGKNLNNETLLSSVFTEGGQNTDLLGLRSVSYFVPNQKNLDYTIGQGEVLFGRNIDLSGEFGTQQDGGLVLDVTATNLKGADETKRGSRVFAVTALGDAEVSGSVTVKNGNAKASSTRNVVAIGAIGSFKVGNNTRVVNEGRVLAVGAGKLQGKSGEQISGLHLEAKGAIAVGSGRNIDLVDASFRVSESKGRLLVYAQETASMTNPTFSGFGVGSEIFMDAKTINLSKVDFPDGSRVKLVSRDGGTADGNSGSGRYPVFGRSEPGRVNFISDVRYGGNRMSDVQSFDTHGGNVSIRKSVGQ
jgi:hypothetical protein